MSCISKPDFGLIHVLVHSGLCLMEQKSGFHLSPDVNKVVCVAELVYKLD